MSSVNPWPADRLEGKTLPSGWLIGPRIVKAVTGTGGNFGICYEATRGGERAFVKAADFRRAFSQPDPVQAIVELGSHLQWEKDVLEFCDSHGLSKIIKLISHEYFLPAEALGDLAQRISCLVLEVGAGDLRSELAVNDKRPF
ncbi:MAG TPA: hypothetical protein VLK29_00110, partial [Luteimonas sp.]|nr:hypothetical protein [Luteimonas sp.]